MIARWLILHKRQYYESAHSLRQHQHNSPWLNFIQGNDTDGWWPPITVVQFFCNGRWGILIGRGVAKGDTVDLYKLCLPGLSRGAQEVPGVEKQARRGEERLKVLDHDDWALRLPYSTLSQQRFASFDKKE